MSAVRKLSVVSTSAKQLKVRVKLRAKPRVKMDMHRLPFVGRDHVQEESGGVCFWDVPFEGGYFGGNETGAAIAHMYLAHLRRANRNQCQKLDLGPILSGMMRRTPRTKEENDSRSGQLMGFASVIGAWLGAAVDQLGERLETADQAALLKAANAGLDLAGAQARFNKVLDDAGFTDEAEHGDG